MKNFFYLAFILIGIAADQLSKWAVMTGIFDGVPPSPAIIPVTGFFNWVVVWNYGVSFGLFNQQSPYGAYLLIGVALIISAIFVVWLFRATAPMQKTGLALVIGGAIGNVIDRLRFGAVFDFLDFHIAGYHWPAFNLADSFIVIGVFVLILYAIVFEKNHEQSKVE